MLETIRQKISPLCWTPSGKLVCYKNGEFMVMDENQVVSRFSIPISGKEKALGMCRYLSRLLRMGIRAADTIDDNHIVYSVGNMLHEIDLNTGIISNGYCSEGGRPLSFSKIKSIDGFEDGLYFGGYLANMPKNPVSVYHRTGEDQWEIIYTFPKGAINHVHNIVPDPYRQCVWIFTGDFGESAAIWKVTDNFKKIERVAGNNQKYRACVVYALPEGLLYATDAPFADDYIYLLNPETMETKDLFPIHGSCIYGCKWKDKYVFSSTVEGDGRNTPRLEFYFGRKRGAGIKDDYVHMYMGNLQEGFKEIYKEKKDCMPYYTFQFGVFRFPAGENNGDTLYFQPVATKRNDLRLMSIKWNDKVAEEL